MFYKIAFLATSWKCSPQTGSFCSSCLQQPSECDPASPGYQQREYRFIRNHLVREEMARSCLPLSGSRINDQIFVNREARPAQLLKFHPYQPQLAVIHRNCWRFVLDIV